MSVQYFSSYLKQLLLKYVCYRPLFWCFFVRFHFATVLSLVTTWDSAVLGADTIFFFPFWGFHFWFRCPLNSFIQFWLNTFLMSSFTRPQREKLIILCQHVVLCSDCSFTAVETGLQSQRLLLLLLLLFPSWKSAATVQIDERKQI